MSGKRSTPYKTASTRVEVAEVVDEDDEGTDDPEVAEVAEEDQEGSESMMEEVLVVVPFRLDQCVDHQPV
mgnify:CR=1 FL=1